MAISHLMQAGGPSCLRGAKTNGQFDSHPLQSRALISRSAACTPTTVAPGPAGPALLTPSPPENPDPHRLPADQVVRSKAVLEGLHHEYWLERWSRDARMELLPSTSVR